MPPTFIYFSSDVSEYMLINGFEMIDIKDLHDGMLWRKDKIAVQFWQNRIEKHEQNALGDFFLTNSYKGFDGRNIQHLIMILHCMGAITIESAWKLANEIEKKTEHISKILFSLPVNGMVCR